MFTLRSRRLLTKLLARNDHGLAFIHQVNDPLLSQQQVRGISNKSLFQFQPTGVMDPDVAKVLQIPNIEMNVQSLTLIFGDIAVTRMF